MPGHPRPWSASKVQPVVTGQDRVDKGYWQGQLEAKGPYIYVHTPFVLVHPQQCLKCLL